MDASTYDERFDAVYRRLQAIHAHEGLEPLPPPRMTDAPVDDEALTKLAWCEVQLDVLEILYGMKTDGNRP